MPGQQGLPAERTKNAPERSHIDARPNSLASSHIPSISTRRDKPDTARPALDPCGGSFRAGSKIGSAVSRFLRTRLGSSNPADAALALLSFASQQALKEIEDC